MVVSACSQYRENNVTYCTGTTSEADVSGIVKFRSYLLRRMRDTGTAVVRHNDNIRNQVVNCYSEVSSWAALKYSSAEGL